MVSLGQAFALTMAVEVPLVSYAAWMFHRRNPEVIKARVVGVWIATAWLTIPFTHYLNTVWLRRFDYSLRMGVTVVGMLVIEALMMMIFTRIGKRHALQLTVALNTVTYFFGWLLTTLRII